MAALSQVKSLRCFPAGLGGRSAGTALVILILLLGPLPAARAGLKIYFVRHAQGGHNVVKEWEGRPREQWPPYVGNEDMFTPRGEKQVQALTARLEAFHFDKIAVSPLWRTRQTILPFLKKHDRQAEIWPELEEFGFQDSPPPWPPAGQDLFRGGPPLILPDEEKPWFILPKDGARRIAIRGAKAESRADVDALMNRIVEKIRSRFGGGEQAILLVGHGSSGSLLLQKLLGTRETLWPENARVLLLEEQRDGTFQLRIFNDAPVPAPAEQ